uniref:Uncharacterized protein n=1 Tax=Anopheles farauti TaxID=69004 RepID=A0A182Q3M6_9DIPT
MASKELLERDEIGFGLLQSILFEEDGESINENGSVMDGEYEDEENCDEDEAAKSEDGEKNSTAEKTKDPVTERKNKKKSQAVFKRLKNVMSRISNPFGFNTEFEVDVKVALNASNVKARRGKTSNAKPNDAETAQVESDKPMLPEATTIKNMQTHIKDLMIIARGCFNEYIKLKTQMGKLSETEGQLATVKNENERLKDELLEMQKQRQNSSSSAAEQTEAYRKEINRLDSELRAAEANLFKMQKADKDHRDALNEANKALETLTCQHDKLKSEIEKKEEIHKLEVNKLNESLHVKETEKTELRTHVQEIQQELQTALLQCNELKEERTKLQQKISDLQILNFNIKANYEASNAKVVDLQRAIHVLESSSSTTTTLQGRGDGYNCPLCAGHFDSLANLQLHAEDCGGL